MKRKILEKAVEMFLNYGFKSVTMDEISKELGISKKTIYAHYKNKTELIKATTMGVFDSISQGIDAICELEKNPIEEFFAIKTFVMEVLKNEKTSPQYQLQKYYPELYQTLKKKQFEVMQDCVTHNLKRGVEQGLFRKNMDINFISRIYFNGILGIKDEETFPHNIFTPSYLINKFLEYHIRAIASPKGLQIMEKLFLENEN